MKICYDTEKYVKMLCKGNDYFHTFINKSSLAVGVLVLEPGMEDTQEPHESDEVYFVIDGDGFLRVNGKDYAVSTNKVFFVAKGVPHFFHGNSNKVTVLYFFGGSDD